MLRPWVHNLAIRAGGQGALSLQIAQAIIEEIQRGRLVAGDPLPGTRDLARHLAVNRKTVVIAFEELAAQGWVKTDARRGTFVLKSVRDSVADLSVSSLTPRPRWRRRSASSVPCYPGTRAEWRASTTACRISA